MKPNPKKRREIDPELAVVACRMLVTAYEQGGNNGGEIEWEDLNDAFEMACQALGLDPEKS